jgi:hypothetical protein
MCIVGEYCDLINWEAFVELSVFNSSKEALYQDSVREKCIPRKLYEAEYVKRKG